jgi:hypothetical protein
MARIHPVGELLVSIIILFAWVPCIGQTGLRAYGTVSAGFVPTHSGMPRLSVVGQTANASVTAKELQPLVGIDYIRLFGLFGSDVEIQLPSQEIPVSAKVTIPVVVRSRSTMNGVRTIEGWCQFTYRCELIDLLDVGETYLGDGLCRATIPFKVDVGGSDTIWIGGVSKLCGITSTALSAVKTMGIAEKGRTRVTVTNGELRQTGHCVTDSSTRLVFSNVNLGVYPQPASNRAIVSMKARTSHEGAVSCFDVHGNELFRKDVGSRSAGESSLEFDVSNLINGTYTLQYVHTNGISSIQLVVQR